MKRVALYCRVSTDQQVREGDSIQAQLTALREYAQKHNYVVTGEYIDDGVSGSLLNERDELQRMLDDVKKREIDIILFTKLDRFFRNVKNYLNTQTVLDEYGVTWRAIWESYETETPQGRLMINQMLSFAQFECENTSQRILRVFDYKKAKHEVVSGKIPFGYKIENKHMVTDPDKAKIVRKVFDLYIQTGNMCETMRLTEGLGLPKTQRAFKWLLKNRKYIGEAYGDSSYCEPIIDRETFDKVQHLLTMNVKKSQKNTYIFSGLTYCKDCGRKMTGTSDRYKGSRYKTYRCMYHYRPLPVCGNSKTLNERKLEEYLVRNLEKFAFEDIKVEKSVDTVDYGKLIEATEKKMSRLKDLYVNELLTLSEYKKDLDEYQRQIAEYKNELSKDQSAGREKLKDLIGTNLADWYWTLTDAEKRTLWRGVIKEIRFGSDKSIDIVFL